MNYYIKSLVKMVYLYNFKVPLHKPKLEPQFLVIGKPDQHMAVRCDGEHRGAHVQPGGGRCCLVLEVQINPVKIFKLRQSWAAWHSDTL